MMPNPAMEDFKKQGPFSEIFRRLAVIEKWIREHITETGTSASAFVGARYSTNAGQSIPDTNHTIVNFEDLDDYDTNAAVTTGVAWKFTAPVAGYYSVKVHLLFDITNTFIAGANGGITIYKNNVIHSYISQFTSLSNLNRYVDLQGSDDVYLAATDFIDIRVFQVTGGARLLFNNGDYNHVAIAKY